MPKQVYRVSSIMAEHMTPEQRDDFMSFCRTRPGAPAIQRYLLDLTGESVGAAAIQNWHTATFPPGKQAELFRELAGEFQGMDVTLAKEWLLGRTANLLSEIYTKIDEGLLEEAAPEQIINTLGTLTREVKSIAEIISREKYIKNRSELELAGAHRLADLIELTFKDSAMEQAVRNAIKGALEQIESEVEI